MDQTCRVFSAFFMLVNIISIRLKNKYGRIPFSNLYVLVPVADKIELPLLVWSEGVLQMPKFILFLLLLISIPFLANALDLVEPEVAGFIPNRLDWIDSMIQECIN